VSRFALTETISGLLGQPVSERTQNALVSCPFHDDRLPSLSIDLDRGLWICFAGCGSGAIQTLARRLGKSIDDVDVALRIYNAGSKAIFEEDLKDFTQLARDEHDRLVNYPERWIAQWFIERHIRWDAVDVFGLGRDEHGRLAIPYFDDGKCYAIKYRDKWGKKSSEPGSRRGILNIDTIRQKPNVIITEGESDALTVWSALTDLGIDDSMVAVGAIPGANVSRQQWELWVLDFMWAKRIYFLFDNDEAGDRGWETVQAVFDPRRTQRCLPTEGKDITEHLLNGGSFNARLEGTDLLLG
jgi:hypothetical protein